MKRIDVFKAVFKQDLQQSLWKELRNICKTALMSTLDNDLDQNNDIDQLPFNQHFSKILKIKI